MAGLSVVLAGLLSPRLHAQLSASATTLFRADRILAKPRAGGVLAIANLLPGASVLRTFPAVGNLQIVQLPAGTAVATALALLRQSGLAEYAEPDAIVHVLATDPDDPRYQSGELWGLHNTGLYDGTPGADVDARDAWDLRTGAPGVVVAVVDTGIRATHEDLAANLWTNPGEIAGNGRDDDGDGYVDDVHGINAIAGNGNPDDDYGHGSHVAGTIGGLGNNSLGVTGVAWRVQLMALKFIDAQGNGAVSDAITCIDYARAHGANIINASWGGPSFESSALHDAIAAARDAGIIFVAAAGNSTQDNDAQPLYPSSYDLDNIVAVAATDRNDNLAFFSDYGATTVDLGAPGYNIFSCWNGSDSDYRYDDGTSMAAAEVSGAVALARAQFPTDTYRQIIQRILSGTDPLPALAGKCVSGGRLNLRKVLSGAATPTPPAAPTGLAATAVSSTRIDLAWTDRASDEQGFQVERSTDDASFQPIATLAADTAAYSDTSVAASTTYYYRVRAFNAAGDSAYSNTASATTPAPTPVPPAAPDNLSASATSSTTVALAWADHADNEQGFDVERSGDGATFTRIATLAANTTGYTDGSLTGDTAYYYRVRATNAAGASGYSNVAAVTTPPAPPPPPQPTVTIRATLPLAMEFGPVPGQFQISRQGASLTEPATVHLAVGGTAGNGIDYQQLPDTVTIPAGQSTLNLKITPVDDHEIEGTETVTVTIAPDAAYLVGQPGSATVQIVDDGLALLSLPLGLGR